MSDRPVPTLTPEQLERIYAQTRREFPSECCGYLLGSGEGSELVECVNRQDKLHELDPEVRGCTSANAYNIGGRELLNLVRSFETERPASLIYHSHPRVGAYFSEEDTNAAEAAGYPVDYLVVDAQDDEIKEAVLFRRAEGPEGVKYEPVARYDGAKV